MDAVRFIWALPGTIIGLVLWALQLGTGGVLRDGVLWIRAKWILPLGMVGQAWGHVILVHRKEWWFEFYNRTPDGADFAQHELEHVRQWRFYGPFFFVVYPLYSLYGWMLGSAYRDNYFEQKAREAEKEPNE